MAWQQLDKNWHDTDVEYCDVCGNLLIQRMWAFEGREGQTIRACREDDARLYSTLHDYVPRIEEARRRYEEREAEVDRR